MYYSVLFLGVFVCNNYVPSGGTSGPEQMATRPRGHKSFFKAQADRAYNVYEIDY